MAVPISLFGWVFSFALAHSSTLFPLLFFWPTYLVLIGLDTFASFDSKSEALVGMLLLVAQIVGYVLMVFAFRMLVRFFKRYDI